MSKPPRPPSYLLDTLERRWSLTIGTPFTEGSCSWVAAVTLDGGRSAVLKIAVPHLEGEQESAGLRFWNGNPTAHLLDADETIHALLLERCEPGTSLRQLPEAEQDVIVAALLRRLWRVPSQPHPFRPLSVMAEYWCGETWARSDRWPDRALISEGLRLFGQLARATGSDVLLATDLHAGNILRAQREPWLVIDPKPFLGDPAYDATQHLLNCRDRLYTEPDRTIKHFADLLGLPHQRVGEWIFARTAMLAGDHGERSRWLEIARRVGATLG